MKGLVIVNVADFSIVTSASICHSLSASVRNGLHTLMFVLPLALRLCGYLLPSMNGERAALEKSVPWL